MVEVPIRSRDTNFNALTVLYQFMKVILQLSDSNFRFQIFLTIQRRSLHEALILTLGRNEQTVGWYSLSILNLDQIPNP